MTKVNMDFANKGKVQGEVAAQMNSGLSVNAMRPFIGADGKAYITVFNGSKPTVQPIQANATLRRDEWKHLDEMINKVAQERLVGVQDLISKGLTYNLTNPMANTVLETHDVDVEMEAELSMDGRSRAKNNRPNYGTNYLPLPIIHVDYDINARVLGASRKMGNPIDTTNAEEATRAVSDKLESLLFTAPTTPYAFGGGTIYGYANHPDRNTVILPTDWDASAKTAENIIADVLSMKKASIAADQYGPWVLYVPTDYETVLDMDYSTSGTSTQTVRDRILKIGGIDDVKVIDKLSANNVLLVQMQSNTVRLVRGMGISNVQWSSGDNMTHHYKVMTIQVPQIRSDQRGQSGIVHLS